MSRTFVFATGILLVSCQGATNQSLDDVEQGSALTKCDGSNKSPSDLPIVNAYLNSPPNNLNWTPADCKVIAPIWTGNDDKGQLLLPLWRGTAAAIEDWVPPPPSGNCEGLKGTVRIDWDKSKNTVHYVVKLRGLPRSPQITRIDGGDPEILDQNLPNHYVAPPAANWWYNPFHPSPKNFPQNPSNGTAYRLWTISTTYGTASTPFYYSGTTLKLQGSAFDYPAGPPPGTFPVSFPIVSIVSSLLFYPSANGNASREWTVPYSQVTGEGGFWSWAPVAFLPHNLCRAVATQPTLGQLRPYAAPFRPANEGLSWKAMMQAGLFFDLTIEEGRPDVPPGGDDNNFTYVYSGLAFLNNAPLMQGGVPWGWHGSLPAIIQNVAPGIQPVPKCGGFVSHPHVTAPLYCQGQH